MHSARFRFRFLTLALLLTGELAAQFKPAVCLASDSDVDFARQILPILSDKCFVCHGPDTRKDGLVRLDSSEQATADLGGYQAINPESPDASELLARINSADDPMPPEDFSKSLSDDEKQLLERWIQSGGNYAKHWAFVSPVARPETSGQATKTVVDKLVSRRLAEEGVEFSEEAAPEVLARRIALVLTGLPPEPSEVQRLVGEMTSAKDREQALERFVDRQLASPAYGEHQARFWLDAARYGDTHGLHLDSRRGIYPYRDWVVKAYNDNLPLDDFITWQLAGDLLPNPTLEQRVATGFVRLNPSTSEGGAIPEEFQAKYSFDRTENVGTVLMGMSLTCARCHTHKYDPITQHEYYSLLAFFNNTAEQPMDRNSYEYGPTAKAPSDQEGWRDWSTRQAARQTLLTSAREYLAAVPDRSDASADTQPDALFEQVASGKGPFADWSDAVYARLIESAEQDASEEYTTTLIAKELDNPRKTFLLHRGEYDKPDGEPLKPDVPSIMGQFPEDVPRNRLGLARWLTSPEHPLVSRVIANQLWQRVFGLGLVRTPEDFGVQGQQPTHPELLDFLAVKLQDTGWDQKAMLKEIVLSRTFRQSSATRPTLDDPTNRLLARGPSFRLDAEVIRDVGLHASNLLDPTMGGEGVKPYQPAGMWKAMAHPASNTKEYVRDKGPRLYRKSLYVYWKRTSPHPMMTLFDAPSRESSCVRREVTNTALQSLAILNETQRLEMSRKFAERLIKAHTDDAERITEGFWLLASRPPADAELATLLELLNSMKQRFSSDSDAAEQLLSYGDAESDKKLDQAELAAWTIVANTLLASDQAILLY